MTNKIKQLQAFDKEHIWHPYTSMTRPLKTYAVKSASGVHITLKDGTRLIDGMSSWWAAIHGYNHPVLNNAAKEQLDKMSHIMFGGLTHDPAVKLSKRLIDITPESLNRIFLCDSGSVSVEVAIKMAFQYWHSLGKPQKNKLITVRSGYHGDTFYAMSVCDPVTGMHHTFKDVLPKHYFADKPGCKFHDTWDDEYIHAMETLIQEHYQSCAAVIIEPVVQGAGGMRFYSPHYLKKLKALCKKYELLLIFDEIATGFGRTGKLFACDHAKVSPDIMCVGKALTGGYLTLAATLATQQVGDVISQGECGVFMHGPTYMGNPLACSIAISNINLLLSYDWESKIHHIESKLTSGLQDCQNFSHVEDVRVLGGIGVVEMKAPVEIETIQQKFVDKGIWIRPFGKLIYTMPPYIIEDDQLDTLTQKITQIVYKEGAQ
ncbi:MAG: adenosylmethionine--8-amino-7-oxononanoate transaminase [Desulfobacteraceae bacterium]|nr:adenosylmethionine--8-amino-7-oxononanoate transaminase [Desulfobacteraceae bacterium]